MAFKLLKIKINIETNTSLIPHNHRFFYMTTENSEIGTNLKIPVNFFMTDTGYQATELPILDKNNGIYNVFINGIIQMNSITEYNPGGVGVGELTIDIPVGGDSIRKNTPIVLELISYNPVTTTNSVLT